MNSKWIPLSEYKNEKPFTVFFSSRLHNDPEVPYLPIIVVPFDAIEQTLTYPWFRRTQYNFATGIDGFDSDNWNDLKESLPENDELVLLKVPKVSLANSPSLEVTESNPEYVRNGNAVRELEALAWSSIPYPLPA